MNAEYPFNDIEAWIADFRRRKENTVQEFFDFSLPVRFHLYWLLEMGTEGSYQNSMSQNKYNYFHILQMVKDRMPAEFYAYFNDLLMDEERDKYEAIFMRNLNGKL